MKLIQLMFLTLVSILPVGMVRSTPLDKLDISQQVVGAAGSYLPLVAQSKQASWEMIKVVTDQFSGTELVNNSVTVSGSYTVVAHLGTPVISPTGRYLWSKPISQRRASARSKRSDPERRRWLASQLFEYHFDGTLPQSATRYLLCILHEKATGQDKFTNVRQVPDGWQKDVLPAVLYLRSHPKVSSVKATEHDETQIRSLLHNSNPYLVLTALQLLAANRSLTTADMDVVLSSTDPKVIAASLVVARFYFWLDTGPQTDAHIDWLTDRVSKTKSLNQLEGIAIGLFAESPLNLSFIADPPGDLPDLPDTTTLPQPNKNTMETIVIPVVQQRLEELDPNGANSKDDQWQTIDSICRVLKP